MRSAWPVSTTLSTSVACALFASSSSFCSPAGVSSALLNAKRTSVLSEIFSITRGGAGGAAATTGAGAACATGTGATAARGTASQGTAALSGDHSAPPRQQRPYGLVATTPAPEPT